MMYLVFYDISNNSIRKKVSDLLLKEGYERLQLSVFLSIENPANNKQLIASLTEITRLETETKLFMLPISKSNLKKMKIIGKNTLDIAYLTGEKKTFFLP